jgi:hypothetical protein
MAIIEDPAGIFANVGEALVGGIKKFTGNFVTHLKQAFISWLTGALSAIEMPEKFDLMGVLSIARQVLGLTWDYLKEKAAELIGEENVERLEWVGSQDAPWSAVLAGRFGHLRLFTPRRCHGIACGAHKANLNQIDLASSGRPRGRPGSSNRSAR